MTNRIRSFIHAFHGIIQFVKLGVNAKIQMLAALGVIVSGLMLEFRSVEWMIVVGCIVWVLSLEALNTSIELLADEISLERKPSIRQIKDIAAGAVLIASIGSTVIAGILISSHL